MVEVGFEPTKLAYYILSVAPLTSRTLNQINLLEKVEPNRNLDFKTLPDEGGVRGTVGSLTQRREGVRGNRRFPNPDEVQPRLELGLQESKPCVITNYTIGPAVILSKTDPERILDFAPLLHLREKNRKPVLDGIEPSAFLLTAECSAV